MKGRYLLISQITSDKAVQEERFSCSKSHCPGSDEIPAPVAKTTPGAWGTAAEFRSWVVFPLDYKLETVAELCMKAEQWTWLSFSLAM